MEFQHKDLAAGRWAQMSLAEQMLNIGSEVSRANRWKAKGNEEQCHRAADRALELVLLTIGFRVTLLRGMIIAECMRYKWIDVNTFATLPQRMALLN